MQRDKGKAMKMNEKERFTKIIIIIIIIKLQCH